ncbi:Crp/Fnr family transcriptional regulator [Qipengyuania sp. 483]
MAGDDFNLSGTRHSIRGFTHPMGKFSPSPFNWIDRLAADERRAVQRALSPLRSREGGDVFTTETNPRGVYRVLGGRAEMYLLSPGGEQVLLKRFDPGESFGEVATLDLEPYPVFVSVDPDTILGFMSIAKAQALMREHPAINSAIQAAVSRYGRAALDFFYSAITGTAAERVLDRLEWLSKNEANSADAHEIEITQVELASMVGLSRQTTNEALAQLNRDGRIRIGKGRIVVRRQRPSESDGSGNQLSFNAIPPPMRVAGLDAIGVDNRPSRTGSLADIVSV